MYQRVRGSGSAAGPAVVVDADIESGADEARREIHILDSSDDENEEGASLESRTMSISSGDERSFSFTLAEDDLFGGKHKSIGSDMSLSRKGKDIVQVVVGDGNLGGVGEE